MKNIKFIISLFLITAIVGCEEETYQFGDLTAPTNLVINTDIVGQSAENPDGDGSGEVIITASADNAITYKIGYTLLNSFADVNYTMMPSGSVNKKFTDPGTNTYLVSVVAYGKGAVSSKITKEITIRSDFVPEESIVTNLTNNASKTWIVNKDIPFHFGVGPWEGDFTSAWWKAGPDEKVACCNCFYTSQFTFVKNANGTYSLTVVSPDGAFTKTGELTNLPGIPATGDEGCYAEYTGGTSSFNFVPASSGAPADTPSTQTSIQLGSTDTFIGYGATQTEYEIFEITENSLFLRVQGTEPGNAWYLKLIPAQ